MMPSPDNTNEISRRLEHAVKIAGEAGQLTLDYYCGSYTVERKSDGSPVTVADRAAEELLRRRISEAFPDDAVLGEEFGSRPGSSGFQWVLDPIDGTKSFIHGVPLYTTLVAVIRGDSTVGVSEIGVIYAPAVDEMVYAARGSGCWTMRGKTKPEPARVSQTLRLNEGLLLTTEIAAFSRGRPRDSLDVFLSLQGNARLVRTWGDAYGYLLVATGRAEAMIDPEVNLWDAAALQPIIEEAGGHFVDWQGNPTVYCPDAIATNGHVTEEILSLTRGR